MKTEPYDSLIADAFDARVDDILQFVQTLEGMDTTDVGMVGDRTIDAIVADWGIVSHLTVTPNPKSVTVAYDEDGGRFTARASLEIRFVDQGVREIETIVTGTKQDGIMGLNSMTVLQIPA